MANSLRLLIIGGAGTFGRRIASLLGKERGLEIVLAGRKLKRLAAVSAALNKEGAKSTPLALNLARDDLAQIIAEQRIDLVIHTAGPFQAQNFDVPRACIRAGADFIDLADSIAYVTRITRLDAAAKQAGRAIISGASTVPALSSAVVEALSQGLVNPNSVTTRITPGNRAPRGRAVVASILSYVGRPIPGWNDGLPIKRIGWSELHRRTLSIPGVRPLRGRWFAACEAPDLELFPTHYAGLKRVAFFAGLEIGSLHLGLWLLSWLPRKGVVRSLRPATGFLRFIALLFRPFGSDRGGMSVEVEGRIKEGCAVTRRWTLIAEAGDGPFVPCLAAVIFVRRRLAGESLPLGAQPCLGMITLPEFEHAMARLRIRTGREEESLPLYRRVLGESFGRLPTAIQAMHDVDVAKQARGETTVRRGHNPVARLIASILDLPKAGQTSIEVTFTPDQGHETWSRRFGQTRFQSVQCLNRGPAPDRLLERYGPLVVSFELQAGVSELRLIPHRAWLGAIPLPRAVARGIVGTERVTIDGNFEFDVRVALPLIGDVVQYRGHLGAPKPI